MNYLIDTNIISEAAKKKPNKGVMQWLALTPSNCLSISVLTLSEIKKGIEMISDHSRKIELLTWLDVELRPWFEGNIIPIDQEVAEKWGYISASHKVPAVDALIAATALVNNLILVTRNAKDFNIAGLEVINPFTDI
ncbi:type II toxin-antitoxin system VapC family toxin [Holosporaceae bacterium 'Namur']|nr:type II toxin-antitoxin system VapC family toxin [Holosporaceae bacterium 'Namur']